jgi:SpoVK/Ycf46/Vps4 family AAA+-type ATPase
MFWIADRSMSDGGSTDSGVAGRVLSTFLNELDGISPPGGNSSVSGDVLVIVACLNADNLDPALVRPGRLQHHFNLGAFYFEDACDIVANLIRKLPEGTKVVTNPEDIVRIFEEKSKSILSPSKVVAFFQQAVLEAVKDVIAENANFDMLESSSSLCPEIDAIHFARALL